MSYMIAVPELLGVAAGDLATLQSSIREAAKSASAATTGVAAAGADEISAAITSLFNQHGLAYQTVAAQAAAFHSSVVSTLAAGAQAYASAEAAGASSLSAAATSPLDTIEQGVLSVVNAPTMAVLGRPLIGDGANAAAGSGANGGAGGILFGNGGGRCWGRERRQRRQWRGRWLPIR